MWVCVLDFLCCSLFIKHWPWNDHVWNLNHIFDTNYLPRHAPFKGGYDIFHWNFISTWLILSLVRHGHIIPSMLVKIYSFIYFPWVMKCMLREKNRLVRFVSQNVLGKQNEHSTLVFWFHWDKTSLIVMN